MSHSSDDLRIVADLGNSRLKWGRVCAKGNLESSVALPLDELSEWERVWEFWNPGNRRRSSWSVSSVNPPVASRPGSRIRNEAIIDLARVSTVRTAEILLDQTSGALENELKELRAMIANGHPGALECVKALLGRAEVGLRLLGGWKIALLGLPNVGKSRLMNALVGFDRSIVSPTAGTTRDVVTIKTAVDGYPVEIADLAGLRETSHPIEREGVARARSQAFQSDLVIVVLDRSTPLNDEARGLLDPNGSQLVVANKVDLEPCWEPWNEGIISISAERGDGIARLLTAIGERLVSEPILPGAGVPFREAHRSALIEVLGALSDKDHNRAIGALQTRLS